MNVILLENVRNLGNLGDTVSVKPGYGRNYLIPQGKAISATPANTEKFEARRTELEKKAADALKQAQDRAEKFNALALTIQANASDEGKLYGSVGTLEIARAIAKEGLDIEKKEIILPEGPIHQIGESNIHIQVHSDIIASVKITVEPSK